MPVSCIVAEKNGNEWAQGLGKLAQVRAVKQEADEHPRPLGFISPENRVHNLLIKFTPCW